MTKYILMLLIITFDCNIYAARALFDFELNKSTIFDVMKLYQITKEEKNYWNGYNYHVDAEGLKEKRITKFLVICGEDQIIQAIILNINSNELLEIHEFLSEEYSQTIIKQL